MSTFSKPSEPMHANSFNQPLHAPSSESVETGSSCDRRGACGVNGAECGSSTLMAAADAGGGSAAAAGPGS